MALRSIPIGYLRGLLVAQNGRCAISGTMLNPHDINGDHIVPLSRIELSPAMDEKNLWLVHRHVNAMKGILTYDEMIAWCRLVLKQEKPCRELLVKIQNGEIQPISKELFDSWAKKH